MLSVMYPGRVYFYLFERRSSTNCASHMSLAKYLGGSTTDVAAHPATTAT